MKRWNGKLDVSEGYRLDWGVFLKRKRSAPKKKGRTPTPTQDSGSRQMGGSPERESNPLKELARKGGWPAADSEELTNKGGSLGIKEMQKKSVDSDKWEEASSKTSENALTRTGKVKKKEQSATPYALRGRSLAERTSEV